jgi:hypothetical protein
MHMTFDDQLQRAFDTLTGRLQDDIRREVQVAIGEVAAAQAARAAELTRGIDAVRTSATADIEATRENAARDVPAAAEGRYRAEQMRGTIAAGRLLDSVRSIGRARSLSETLDTLVGCAAREAERAAVLTVRGGALRGWRFIGFGALDQNPALDGSFDDRGLSDRARQTRDVAADDRGCAIPLALGGDVVSVLFADNGNGVALELLARHAARSLEALVAFKVARAISAPHTSVPAGEADADDVAARRYARLLVSEIRLYHEPEVIAGRRDGSLTSRLGGEIARARSLYERRVPPQVRQHAAYFEEELVRTLADGDSTLLAVKS